jgi:hypothetical protein
MHDFGWCELARDTPLAYSEIAFLDCQSARAKILQSLQSSRGALLVRPGCRIERAPFCRNSRSKASHLGLGFVTSVPEHRQHGFTPPVLRLRLSQAGDRRDEQDENGKAALKDHEAIPADARVENYNSSHRNF